MYYLQQVRRTPGIFPKAVFSQTAKVERFCFALIYLCKSHSVMSNSLWPQGLYSPWNSPGQNTGVGGLSLLQGIFWIQASNPGLPHYRQILYQLSHREINKLFTWLQQVLGEVCWSLDALWELLVVASISMTRDQTQAPFIGSMESYPLDHQGSSKSEEVLS